MPVNYDFEWQKHADPPPPPTNDGERLDLCGWGGPDEALDAKQELGPDMPEFEIMGQTISSAGKAARLWLPFVAVTGHTPDLTPQPTGNCVAAAADDVIEGTQCIEIKLGEAEKFRPIYNPYHYATGRVIVGKNRLRGGAGSLGSWQSKAIELHGVIPLDQDGLPKYNRANVDAWGDDKTAGGKTFREYLEQGAEHLIRTTSFADVWEKLRDGLFNGYFATIASNRGYTMQPGQGGMHHASGSWSHQMSNWGYSEEGPEKDHWMAIKNQWGNVHGKVTTPQGDELPPGFLLVPLQEFIDKHLLLRGCECILYSRFDGFPEQRKKVEYDFAW